MRPATFLPGRLLHGRTCQVFPLDIEKILIDNVLVDTGSATTIFSADRLSDVQVVPLPDDTLHIIRGVGGSETVFSRRIDYLQVAGRSVSDFEIEVGGMDYGFAINGILGMDYLTIADAVIDLGNLTLYFGGDDKLA